jgi:hypothetical protein
MTVTIPARLSSLPDDVLRALATFGPLSDLLVLVRCSRHFRMVLQSQLNRCLDRLFAVTHYEDHWGQKAGLVSTLYLPRPNQLEQRVLYALFGEADMRGNWRVYHFIGADGQSMLRLSQYWQYVDLHLGAIANTYICGKTQSDRDRFASWLRYRCEQQMATEPHA